MSNYFYKEVGIMGKIKEDSLIGIATEYLTYTDSDDVANLIYEKFKDEIYRDLNIKSKGEYISILGDGNLYTHKELENANNYTSGYICEYLKGLPESELVEFAKKHYDENFMLSDKNGSEIYPRFAIVTDRGEEGTQTLEDYDSKETAIEAFKFIKKTGYHETENDGEKIYFKDIDNIAFDIDVELWDGEGNHKGFDSIEEVKPFTLINGNLEQKYKVVLFDLKEVSKSMTIDELAEFAVNRAIENNYEIIDNESHWGNYLEKSSPSTIGYYIKGLKDDLTQEEKLEISKSIMSVTEDAIFIANNHLEESVENVFHDITESSPGNKDDMIENCVNTLLDDFWENYHTDMDMSTTKEWGLYPVSEEYDSDIIKKLALYEANKYNIYLNEEEKWVVSKENEPILDVVAEAAELTKSEKILSV